ncbi:hypothetical protein ACHWQZ_G012970 [Mnemiopsis leidyi]
MQTLAPVLLLLLLISTRRVQSASPYYIIVRLPANSLTGPLSAQFQQIHNADLTPQWNCKSGVTPLTFPQGEQNVINAKSMDMEVGSVVECLGLVVKVTVGRDVRLWLGEASKCGQSLQATTTELTRTNKGVSELFSLKPVTLFSVYSVEPTSECAEQSIKYVDPPKLTFKFLEAAESKCSVISNDLHVVTCNMTLTAGSKGIVAMATGTTEINVPEFIWEMDASTIKCTCTCGIKENYSISRNVITTSIIYNNSISQVEPVEETSSQEHHPVDINLLLLILGVLSAMLLSSVVSTIFFFNLARTLKRKLNKAKRPSVPPKAPPSFEPPVQYSRVHRITNECHHYNTVSLELTDCLGLESGQCTGSDRPVYQKLRSCEVDEVEC